MTRGRHGKTGTRLHGIWLTMKSRCNNPNFGPYRYYGARGIKVCAEWHDDFMAFHNWAMANGYADDLSIDRIDSDGNYEPSNCQWTDSLAQNRNRRDNRLVTAFGETKAMSAWAEDHRCAVGYSTLRSRIQTGTFTSEEAITLPARARASVA